MFVHLKKLRLQLHRNTRGLALRKERFGHFLFSHVLRIFRGRENLRRVISVPCLYLVPLPVRHFHFQGVELPIQHRFVRSEAQDIGDARRGQRLGHAHVQIIPVVKVGSACIRCHCRQHLSRLELFLHPLCRFHSLIVHSCSIRFHLGRRGDIRQQFCRVH